HGARETLRASARAGLRSNVSECPAVLSLTLMRCTWRYCMRAGRQTMMQTRPIPFSGEQLPVIGCGTYRGFDVRPDSAAYSRLRSVLDALFAAGGSAVDSSPMY